MIIKKTAPSGLALALLLVLASSVLASSSPSYGLHWSAFTGGGGAASSAQYRVRASVATSGLGVLQSTGYRVSLGYWPGIPGAAAVVGPTVTPVPSEGLYLPLVRRGG